LTDVYRFKAQLDEALERLPKHQGPHQLLYDVSAASIQSQQVVQALRKIAVEAPRTSAFALVNASALAGRQLSRIFSGASYQLCSDRTAAVEWLDSRLVSDRQAS
jgi:hypothetical protein